MIPEQLERLKQALATRREMSTAEDACDGVPSHIRGTMRNGSQ